MCLLLGSATTIENLTLLSARPTARALSGLCGVVGARGEAAGRAVLRLPRAAALPVHGPRALGPTLGRQLPQRHRTRQQTLPTGK